MVGDMGGFHKSLGLWGPAVFNYLNKSFKMNCYGGKTNINQNLGVK